MRNLYSCPFLERACCSAGAGWCSLCNIEAQTVQSCTVCLIPMSCLLRAGMRCPRPLSGNVVQAGVVEGCNSRGSIHGCTSLRICTPADLVVKQTRALRCLRYCAPRVKLAVVASQASCVHALAHGATADKLCWYVSWVVF